MATNAECRIDGPEPESKLPKVSNLSESEKSTGSTATGAASNGMLLVGNQWSFVDSAGNRFLHDPATDSWNPVTDAELNKIVEGANCSESGNPGKSAQQQGENMQCVNGVWVYREPSSGAVSLWDLESNSWVGTSERSGLDGSKESFSGSEKDTDKDKEEKGEDTEAKPNEELDDLAFQLKQEEMERKTKGGIMLVSSYRDPNDGTVYEWDQAAKAWFPKVDEDFIAKYQANYGIANVSGDDATASGSGTGEKVGEEEAKTINETIRQELMTPEEKQRMAKEKKKEKKQKKRMAMAKQKEEGWFEVDETVNTNVYVSDLPLDLTDEDFKELMSKCGLIAQDPRDRKLKLKLYRNEDGSLKGDGRCCYIRKESVDLALQILDGSEVKGKRISVQPAHFEMKGQFDPAKKKRKLTAQQKKKFKEREERLFDWRPEKLRGERPKSDCTTILKNVFSPQDFLNAAKLLDLEEELKQECSKYGEVRKVTIYDNNEDGVVGVTFESAEMSDDCITMMNWRIFHGRQIQASVWDGKTKYKVKETEEEREKRMENWNKYLDNGE